MQNFHTETGRIGKRGSYTIPSAFRKRFGLDCGSLVIAEECENGILIRPAVITPVEIYSDETIAGFLLSNATDEEDYKDALTEASQLAKNPEITLYSNPA
jgi:bifunctional DNA-binding transcriptional regulator/antitoxin component of YhaV-PrlF toxin-antitoxin module